jgi:nucleoside-diphosphate-sugar epimerase
MTQGGLSETIFNIGYEKVHSFDQLVKGIKSYLPDLRLEIIPGKAPENRAIPLDCSRAKKILGWAPKYKFEDAIKDYAKDLRKRLSNNG